MRLKKLIKRFEFLEEERGRVVLGSGTRLVPGKNRLTLMPDAVTGLYSVDPAGKTARTWVSNPTSLRQWLLFQATASNPEVDGLTVTSVRFRLNDGVSDRWWDGAAWVVNSTNWNTEDQVCANVAAFPVSTRKIQVVLNLVTTDPEHTPSVECVALAWSSDVEVQEDVIYRSLIPLLEGGLRPISDALLDKTATGTTVSLAVLETPYDIVGVDSVFNETDDPLHATDLFLSYDVSTKVVTLSASVTAGKVVRVRFMYRPPVYFGAHQDFSQVAKVPALVLDNADFKGNEIPARDHVMRKTTGVAVIQQYPWMGALEIGFTVLTDKGVDHQRLVDEVKRLFSANPYLTSRGLDERYRLWLVSPQYDSGTPTDAQAQAGLHVSRFRARVPGVIVPRDAVDGAGVTALALTLAPNLEQV